MDDKQKKQMAVIGVLLAVLAGIWYVVLFGTPFDGNSAPPAPAAEPGVELDIDYPDFGAADLIAQAQSAFESEISVSEMNLEQWDGRDIFVSPSAAVDVPVSETELVEEDDPEIADSTLTEKGEEEQVNGIAIDIVDSEDMGDVAELKETMELSGIIWSSKDPVAVINNSVVREGDVLEEGITVERITRESVVLTVEYNEVRQRVELNLNP